MDSPSRLEPIVRHHHFRTDLIPADDRISKLEARIVEELVGTDVPDAERDSSIAWELKHQAAVTQFGRLLGAKRSLEVDVAAAGALLHDVYTIRTGSYEDHARRGGPIAGELLAEVGGFTPGEASLIDAVVVNHSDKHVRSTDVWAEFGKDVDVLDCFLYPHALDEYLMTKPLAKVRYYLQRAKEVWDELGIPHQPGFSSLDDFTDDGWLVECAEVGEDVAATLLAEATAGGRPFAISREDDGSLLLSSAVSAELDGIRPGASRELLPERGQMLLVWPGLGRYELLSNDAAAEKLINLDPTQSLGDLP